MFFVLSKLLEELLYPLPMAILLFAVAVGLRRRRPRAARRLCGVTAICFVLLSIEPVADLLLLPLERPYTTSTLPQHVDCIVVLSGGVDVDLSSPRRVELNSAADRIVAGVVLARRYPNASLILSGGSGSLLRHEQSEAVLTAALAEQLGIPRRQILLDSVSRNTWENAVETKRIMTREHLRSCVLVTSAFHMTRALACFHRAGVHPIPFAVDFRGHWGQYDLFSFIPKTEPLALCTAAMHEYIGMLMYRIAGYL